MRDGSSAEIAIAGNDGIVGIALFMGGETTSSRAVVQNAGYAYRVPAAVIKREFDRGGALQLLLLRYTQALITQIAQTASPSRHRGDIRTSGPGRRRVEARKRDRCAGGHSGGSP